MWELASWVRSIEEFKEDEDENVVRRSGEGMEEDEERQNDAEERRRKSAIGGTNVLPLVCE